MMHNDHNSWYKLIGVIVATVLSAAAYVYGNFETKSHSDEILQHVIRIENTLNNFIINSKN